MDIIEEAKKANELKQAADAATKKAKDHAAWTKRQSHCIAWFKHYLGITVEPYGTDYHGVLCRTDEGLHFAWRANDERLAAGGPGYRKYTGNPAATLLYRKPFNVTVSTGPRKGEERSGHHLYAITDGMSHNRVFYDLAGLGACLEQAEKAVAQNKGAELIWFDKEGE